MNRIHTAIMKSGTCIGLLAVALLPYFRGMRWYTTGQAEAPPMLTWGEIGIVMSAMFLAVGFFAWAAMDLEKVAGDTA